MYDRSVMGTALQQAEVFYGYSTLVLPPPRINTFFLSASYSAMEMAIVQFLTFSEILLFDLNQITKK